MAILADLTQTAPMDMLMELAKLRAENEKLKAQGQSKLKLKVSEKGALSVYGLGRFPVTLYRGQWERLLGAKAILEGFIAANSASLTTKD